MGESNNTYCAECGGLNGGHSSMCSQGPRRIAMLSAALEERFAALNELFKKVGAENARLRDALANNIIQLAQLRAIGCRGNDPTCPCHDGDACHYRGENPMKTPDECTIERITIENANLRAVNKDLLDKLNASERKRQ